ncbi:PmoA family protein [Rubripirellula sp.]|nr:PmoA family protein [Rubripirellula sp.]
MFSKSPRFQVVPFPHGEVAIVVDGRERLRWHAGKDSPRPFFFPLVGPAGLPLTRMGHPGAPNHDHHRSIWFAHNKVLGGIDFWSDESEARIRQHQWLAYEDSDEAARLAVELGWYDGHNPEPLIKQQMIASVSLADDDGLLLEIQTSLASVADSLELGQTNFGLLAVRVAKSISAVFGDGVITGANGLQTESKLFGKSSPWIDYSGSVKPGVIEGITYFDHPDNQSFPSKWHVRDDGWMGASICRDSPVMLTQNPTSWRYQLHAHAGTLDMPVAQQLAEKFRQLAPLIVERSKQPHHHATIRRMS